MEKKKGKNVKGKNVKGKEDASEKRPESPAEKELFEAQLEHLREQLKVSEERLTQGRAELVTLKVRLKEELDSKKSCIAYLKRKLQSVSDRRSDFQERLQTERDLGELAERRALAKSVIADRSHEDTKSSFQQKKTELEGELFLLEERRLTRNSQQANLRKMENKLDEKVSNLRQMTREKDATQVDRLLRNREHFVSMCGNMKTEWKEAFKLRMPVQAKQQLTENIRLRAVCRDTTRHLLKAQDRNRVLKRWQKGVDLEEEIQTFAEENAEARRDYQERRLQRLTQIQQRLLSRNEYAGDEEDLEPGATRRNDPEVAQSPFSYLVEENSRQQTEDLHAADSEYKEYLERSGRNEPGGEERTRSVVDENVASIRGFKMDQCRVQDTCRDLGTIAGDQTEYRKCLECRIEEQTEMNGTMMSAILRAGKIFQSRCGKGELKSDAELDFDVLRQIGMILSLPVENDRR